MTEVPAGDRGPDRMQSWLEILETLGPQALSEKVQGPGLINCTERPCANSS